MPDTLRFTRWRNRIALATSVAVQLLIFPLAAPAYDLIFNYTSFESTFGQAQFNVLNYPSINGHYMMTSTDNHRPEMVANGNALAEFYNNFLVDYNKNPRPTAAQEADIINAYTLRNSNRNGPRPDWLILNEISPSLWQQSPGAPSLNAHRQWVIDTVTRLHDVYGYNVITYSPYQQLGTTANGPSWQALAEKSYIAIEAYLSGPEVMGGGTDYASRVAYAQGRYQAAKNSYTAAGVHSSRLFVSEHFANNNTHLDNGTTVTWGRAGMPSAADWDQVIMIRQDAMFNVGFEGFLAYNWGGNGLGVTQAEQIQHEYYYRSRRVLRSQQPQWLSDTAINVNGTVIPLSWSQPLNWLGGVPNAIGGVANFWRTNTAVRSITLDGSKTVGTLTFTSPQSYTITAGTGGSLWFNNSGGPATLTSNQGSHTISVPLQLQSDLSAAINAGTLTISGVISGQGDITKTGAGTLALTATNSYTGDTVVQEGPLRINHPSLSDTADVYLSTVAFINLNFTSGEDVIDSLFIDGVSQHVGIWGAVGSGAPFTSPRIVGAGRLQVTTFIAPPLAGDFNGDGVVDAADYIVWRVRLGATYTEADYEVWRANFGRSAGSGASNTAAVPEPCSSVLLLLAVATFNQKRRKSALVVYSRTAARSGIPPCSNG
ncbi:MAG TPA: autotransporter-associated beta strand repeat-containing protein [Lacipirellulaceae bacterium]|nr:autotransporter-associated beta strand repeat-containing protein [Lacipirellulaceae bacterium]